MVEKFGNLYVGEKRSKIKEHFEWEMIYTYQEVF